jgi:leucyl-tRNA synthetase
VLVQVMTHAEGDRDSLTAARGLAIADAHIRFLCARGEDVTTVDGPSQQTPSSLTALRDRGLVYERGGRWWLRRSAYDERNERSLDTLAGWSDPALAAQRRVLARVEGFEHRAVALGGAALTVFTTYRDAVCDAAFVALSPHHEALADWVDVEAVDRLLTAADSEDAYLRTDGTVQVAGATRSLPVIVWSAVDAACGPTAMLGVPAREQAHAQIAERLAHSGGVGWHLRETSAQERPAARYRAGDVALAPATLDRVEQQAGLKPQITSTDLLVHAPADAEAVLTQRMLAKALGEGEEEPYARAVLYGDVSVDARPTDAGTDALRFALLYAAAPAKPVHWRSADLQHCKRFLAQLSRYALPRLAPDPDVASGASVAAPDQLARRLQRWRATAGAKITANLSALEMHRATRNLMLLLTRIEDFEQRVLRQRPLNPSDHSEIAAALRDLLALLAPIAPQTVEELWRGANVTPVPAAPRWPVRDAA